MADMEKITINVSVVDLGRIELLVEQGFYASRTEFVRAAIRNQLEKHDMIVEQAITRKAGVLGVLSYSEYELQGMVEKGERRNVTVIGMFRIDDEVPPDLARAAIASVEVHGVFQASDAVKEALADRTK